jgi:hypothetical protein
MKSATKPAIGVLVDFLGRADLQHAAVAHHRDAGGHGHGLLLVVRHHDAGHAHGFKDVDELELRAFAQFFVQRAQGFVEQQQLGPLGQASRQRHALLLAARELVRLAFGKSLELDQLEHLLHAGRYLALGHTFALEAEGDVVPDRQVRKQRVRLEHHVDGPLVGRKGRDVHAVQDHRAGGRFLKTRQHAQQGRFAAAGAAQQCEDFAFVDGQGHVVHRCHAVKALDQLVGPQIAITGR